MRAAIVLLLPTLLALAPLPVEARPTGEIAEIATKLDDDDMVEKTYGALGAQHYGRRHWGFNLFSDTDLRDWERASDHVPVLVELAVPG